MVNKVIGMESMETLRAIPCVDTVYQSSREEIKDYSAHSSNHYPFHRLHSDDEN